MAESSRSRSKVGGSLPMVETRSKYARLMRQGIGNAEACRILNINRRTGMRWRHGRTIKNAQGRETTYAPISLKAPPTISSRYLSEGERIQIADALHAGKSLRQIATVLGRSPSTVSRELARNRSPRLKRYAPRAAQALADAARKRPRLGKIAGSVVLRDGSSADRAARTALTPPHDGAAFAVLWSASERAPGGGRQSARARSLGRGPRVRGVQPLGHGNARGTHQRHAAARTPGWQTRCHHRA